MSSDGTRAQQPRLSIVIPVYNVEKYVDECLASVAEQEFQDFEAVVVDDGSIDDSAEITRRWCERDDRFRLIQQPNGGLGHARNTGAANARGQYLAFLDSDDLAPADAYRRMVEVLDETGSDFAVGNVRRFNSVRTWQAAMYKNLMDSERLSTHVSREPELLRDHLAPNKVWRMSFWRDKEISFPAGVLYEDVPTVIPAHVRATAVDVLPIVATLWRVRDRGDVSITQEKHCDPRQVRDRVDALLANTRFIAASAHPRLKDEYDAIALRRDLRMFLQPYANMDEEHRRQTRLHMRRFISEASAAAMRKIPVDDRVAYALIERDRVAELEELLRARRARTLRDTPVEIAGRRAYLDLSLRGRADLRLPERLFDVTDELSTVSRVSDIRVDGDHVEIDGWAYVSRLHRPNRPGSVPKVWLASGKLRIAAKVTSREEARAEEQAHPPDLGCEKAGFTARLPLRRLRRLWRWSRRTWTVMVSVSNGAITLTEPLTGPLPGQTQRPLMTALDKQWWWRMWWNDEGHLIGGASREPAVVTGSGVHADGAEIEVTAHEPIPEGAALSFHHKHVDPIRLPLEADADEPRRGRCRVTPAMLPGVESSEEDKSVRWMVKWDVPESPRRRLLVTGLGAVAASGDDGRTLTPARTNDSRLKLIHGHAKPILRRAEWLPEGGLRLTVEHQPTPETVTLVLSARKQAEELAVVATENEGVAEAVLPVHAVESFGQRLPLREGDWDVKLRTNFEDTKVTVDEVAAALLPLRFEHDGREYALLAEAGKKPVLKVTGDLGPAERGKSHQDRLRTGYYRRVRGNDLDDAILYESYFGKQFSDSPRDIHEELTRREHGLKQLVAVRDRQFTVPDGVTPVVYRSKDYYRALARSRFIVTNTHLPSFFQRSPGQTVLQTWHGVGTKKIGMDIGKIGFANESYKDNLATETRSWDYLISPNQFCSPIMTRAFAYRGKLLETGAPRNDIFHRPDREEIAASVRQQLGIAPDRKIVLYAPTWRDNLHSRGRYRLDLRVDLAELAGKLGDGYAVVFRKHSNIADKLPARMTPPVIDASDYPDVQRLLLVTDILISDYSTTMCDFANTGRPMLFFTYDLENYRNVLRDFYFDFEATVPGPLVFDEAELAQAVAEADTIRREYDDKYQAFQQRFCSWDDGGATRRVVDAVFGDVTRG
ncbi:bifunctional glycosyltransferase/CDP-glycerol:glycerophosphate glycerophosphotransferase [Stackebrandtia nassauensis]|uniref:CDP-glycerol:poly(Glycerophosphate)glycerophosphotransferase n=1 Tax=Stackebrandtia nassauensis (strain DSM 44728 / CIP 108903 / NRRL B-16338 / NBRC 102104 / LLR-40K-21) TaxID=446470 RepID=D3Q7V2_STANL|nr:bifunctional glycosyltransferase family 2 protein/CDP-glycerol:glycerophosphate glycerophosphotransferase [Stackebrandtia nassauensis]ADD40457.1 CDP-glycerol:poly(glycerophosphate)glycerophosphotransferase [Stackebrandtia nassauensis DSM 44728]